MPAATDSIPATAVKKAELIDDKTTRRFYEQFKKKRKAFYDLTSGINDHPDRTNKEGTDEIISETNQAKQLFVSLVLHRLMFCYFLQKNGLLDGNVHYLRDKLQSHPSFYSSFLVKLFNVGLSTPERTDQLKNLLGDVPYLSAGLFKEHEIEKKFVIEIDDRAFELIFSFFDEWEWTSGDKINGGEKILNPDIVGHIFEKYINDRAQMGAYYTNGDITDYISSSCILPWLFEETERNYRGSFNAGSIIGAYLQSGMDAYVFAAAKHGMDEPLPSEIEAGIRDATNRNKWNKQAPSIFALPGETWREIIERREHFENVTRHTSNDAVQMNDFITFNLNIKKFAKHVIEQTDDALFLETFYKSLSTINVLDPTCGSGAFLLAAINILQPLHESCIRRMEKFIQDAPGDTYQYFHKVLDEVRSSQNTGLRFSIIKSIINNNLFGVDIMQEAVETAKMRLLIRLLPEVEALNNSADLLETLPQINFNLRTGNALIGFVSTDEPEKNNGINSIDPNRNDGKDHLNAQLNKQLFEQSGSNDYEEWLSTHQPFNWL
ncbi:MAG TPA: DNA methyltransferase, partial [Chitinophagaceae bacterium]